MGGIVPEEEVALRDGSRVLIRSVQPGDKALFAESRRHFGEESRYRRFLGAKGDLSARDLAYFTEVDHVDHEAIARERGLADALRAAPKGLVRLRP
jgi:hypothetical protein